ncbi:hypothetical protein [Ruminococcus sp.]|uniref:putative ABC transporter permease n=1 Tax=Ruminococcus sp. TaxID=41978 RepID=UPI0025F8D35A|nr:hypothetical protein [Ruminococcus sp.]
MRHILELLTASVTGALIYGGIEVAERGYSHISMGLMGAFAMAVIHELNAERRAGKIHLFYALLISAFFITASELLAGEILNRRLEMGIWNYHNMRFNYDGQICLRYSLAWLLLSFFGFAADDLMCRYIFRRNKRPES